MSELKYKQVGKLNRYDIESVWYKNELVGFKYMGKLIMGKNLEDKVSYLKSIKGNKKYFIKPEILDSKKSKPMQWYLKHEKNKTNENLNIDKLRKMIKEEIQKLNEKKSIKKDIRDTFYQLGDAIENLYDFAKDDKQIWNIHAKMSKLHTGLEFILNKNYPNWD